MISMSVPKLQYKAMFYVISVPNMRLECDGGKTKCKFPV